MESAENGEKKSGKICEVSVVIVTYNSAECLEDCLESVVAQIGVAFEIIVVDNNSFDETTSVIQGKNCLVVENKENIGFGRACNIGFSKSTGKYVYFLNPDAQLEGDRCLEKMCQEMDKNPHWGIAGTKVLSMDGCTESAPAKKYPGENHVSRDFSKLPGAISWIIGASMIIHREIYQKLKGFDPDYFLYSEETDLCLRARENGFEIGYMEDVVVRHIGGKSESQSDPYDVACRKLRGLLTFRAKHYPQAECIDLAKRDLRRAFVRMAWNRMASILRPSTSKEWLKYRNYRGVWDTSRDYLSGIKKKT